MPNLASVADDPVGLVGTHSSIAIGADGLPVISHQFGENALRVTKCGNAACSAGNVSTTVDDQTNPVGYFASIAVGADGLPVISHVDPVAAVLRVTKCGNPSCTAGPVSTTVDDPVNSVGGSSSIAIGADGLPIISHTDLTVDALRITKCGNAFCTAGNVSTTVDDQANEVGSFPDIAIGADGLPVISHTDTTADAVRVTKCGNLACTVGNVTTTVDDHPSSVRGAQTSIVVPPDGRPIISYVDSTASALRVTKCGNPACTAGNVSTAVDDPDPGMAGTFGDLAIGADGRPIISHRDGLLGGLRVTRCGNPSCSAGNVSGTVDTPPGGNAGWSTSIAIGSDGLPVISHHDAAGRTLRVVKCGTQSCQ